MTAREVSDDLDALIRTAAKVSADVPPRLHRLSNEYVADNPVFKFRLDVLRGVERYIDRKEAEALWHRLGAALDSTL